MVGAYYEKSEPINGIDGNRTSFEIFFGESQGYRLDERRSRAIYLQGSYDLGHASSSLNRFKLTLGARHTWDWSSIKEFRANDLAGTCGVISPTPFPNCLAGGETESDRTTWTASLDYQWTQDVMLYFTSRRGYKQGGINTGAPLQIQEFSPEDVTDYEIGIKSEFSVGQSEIRLNAAAYHIDYSDVQKVLTTAVGLSATVNAAEATIEGIEIDTVFIPNQFLKLSAAYAYTRGEFEDFVNPHTGEDLSDIRYPLIPKNKVSIAARFFLPVNPGLGELSFTTTYSYQSEISIIQAGLPEPGSTIDGYGLLNLSVDWRNISGSSFDATLFATNVTDKEYLTSTFNLFRAVGYSYGYPGEPRMYGVKVGYRF